MELEYKLIYFNIHTVYKYAHDVNVTLFYSVFTVKGISPEGQMTRHVVWRSSKKKV